jgi:hypothetical protein
VLFAERLRDGRIALGTRVQQRDGSWEPGELHLLEPAAYLDLAAWLTAPVEDAWIETVRDRQTEPLRTAGELYGDDPGAIERLLDGMLREIPPALLLRAMVLLANSIGPQSRERLVSRLNQTGSPSEEAELRRQLADEGEAFAYAVAAAALYDALERGLPASSE